MSLKPTTLDASVPHLHSGHWNMALNSRSDCFDLILDCSEYIVNCSKESFCIQFLPFERFAEDPHFFAGPLALSTVWAEDLCHSFVEQEVLFSEYLGSLIEQSDSFVEELVDSSKSIVDYSEPFEDLETELCVNHCWIQVGQLWYNFANWDILWEVTRVEKNASYCWEDS